MSNLEAVMIKHEGDKWILFSKDGSKVLGEFDTEEEAKAREGEIIAAQAAQESDADDATGQSRR